MHRGAQLLPHPPEERNPSPCWSPRFGSLLRTSHLENWPGLHAQHLPPTGARAQAAWGQASTSAAQQPSMGRVLTKESSHVFLLI